MTDIQGRLVGCAAALLAIVGILAGCFFWGRGEGVKAEAKRLAPKIERLEGDLELCRGSVDRLTASLERQNSAVDMLKAEADDRAKRASAAIARAEQQAATYRAKADRLATARPGPDLCQSARELIVQSLSEDRQ